MKKIILSLLVVLNWNLKAQLPEMDFDVLWNNSLANAAPAPAGWITTNLLTSVLISSLNPVSVTPYTASSCSGNTSMRIETKVYGTRGILASYVPDTAGFAFSGNVVVTDPTPLKDGFAFTQRPTHLVYCVQTQPAAGDTSGIRFRAWKTTGGVRTYIASVTETFSSSSPVLSMETHTLSISYTSTLTPDSAGFYVASSFKFPASGLVIRKGAKQGSYIVVDGILLGTNIGLKETAVDKIDLTVFPNPANHTTVQFKTESEEAYRYQIFDVTGREQAAGHFSDRKALLSTQHFNSGIYFYTILNSNGQNLKTGKLIIN